MAPSGHLGVVGSAAAIQRPDRLEVRLILRAVLPSMRVSIERLLYLCLDQSHARSHFLTVPRGSLHAHDSLGGHTVADHVGLSAAQLRERLAREPRRVVVSTFWNDEAATAAVSYVLHSSAHDVLEWLVHPHESRARFDVRLPVRRSIGFAVSRGHRAVRSCVTARVVLERLNAHQFFVLTAFPV